MRPKLKFDWRDLLAWVRYIERPLKGPRSAVPSNFEAQAKDRYCAITPLIEFRNMKHTQLQAFLNRRGSTASSMNEIARLQALKYHVSSRTIWRWYSRLVTQGYAELVDRPRRDRGIARRFARSPRVRRFVENAYLENHRSFSGVHRDLLREWTRLRSNAIERPPAYGTVRNYLNSLPRSVVELAWRGESGFRQACGKSYERIVKAVEDFKQSEKIN